MALAMSSAENGGIGRRIPTNTTFKNTLANRLLGQRALMPKSK